jgi:uncharacterized membrane protein
MESEIAGWFAVIFRFVHVLAAIMWIGNSVLFSWMELNLIAPRADEENPRPDLLGHLDMLHGGGVFHLEKKLIDPKAIPVPLHWFMWQSYTTWISGVLLLIVAFYSGGGTALLDATRTSVSGGAAIALSAGGIVVWWLVYDSIWRSKLKDKPAGAVLLTFVLLLAAVDFFSGHFNGRALYLQTGAMLGSAMSANVFFHIIRNQKKFMASLKAGEPHDLKYGKQAKMRSMHNHYMTFPVLFMMLAAHFPQLTSAARAVPVLAVVIVALMAVKHLMNSRYHFKHWLAAICGTFAAACGVIALLLSSPVEAEGVALSPAAEGAKLFVGQGCAACHQQGSSQLAPDLAGIYNSEQVLADGSKVTADEAYLLESIRQPQAKVVRGYAAAMPSYAHLPEDDLAKLLEYLKSL